MATSESYPQQAQKKRFPGHHPCIHHTMLAEMFKEPAETMCRKCFTYVGKNQIRLIGMLLVRAEYLYRRVKILEQEVDEIKENINELEQH